MRTLKQQLTATHNIIAVLIVVMTALPVLSMAADVTLLSSTSKDSKTTIIKGGFGCEGNASISPKEPSLGDIITVTFTLDNPYSNIPEFRVKFIPLKGVELVAGELIQMHPPLSKGGVVEFSIKTKVTARIFQLAISAHARGRRRRSDDDYAQPLCGDLVEFVALAKNDTISYEKFGNDPDLWPRIGPEYRYDIIEGVIVPPGAGVSQNPKETREEMETLKKIDPTLTDWEALEMLHDAIYGMIVKYGIHKKEESLPILLEARRIMQTEGLSKWEAVDKVLSEIRGKGKSEENFFRNDSHSGANRNTGNISRDLVDITLSGTIKYKKHLAHKNSGLDTATIDVPLRRASNFKGSALEFRN